VQPRSSDEAIEQLEMLSSPIKAYVRDRCHVGPQHAVPVELLFQDYRAWCDDNGCHKASKHIFGRDLHAAVPSLRNLRPRDGERRGHEYQGIGMKERNDETQSKVF
jgi:putative DNA primase/helicase